MFIVMLIHAYRWRCLVSVIWDIHTRTHPTHFDDLILCKNCEISDGVSYNPRVIESQLFIDLSFIAPRIQRHVKPGPEPESYPPPENFIRSAQGTDASQPLLRAPSTYITRPFHTRA
jgi:hypothetical protein